jgi:two-component system response regulator YesN
MNEPKIYKYLVVEDEPLIRHNALKKISELGLPIQFAGEAENGQAALELAQSHFPHFIITDIRMPVMDGLQLARCLYEAHPQIKCVILSGYDDFKYAQEALKYGVTDFLLKPIKSEELKTALQRVVVQLDAEHQQQSVIDAQGLSADQLNALMLEYLRANYRAEIVLSRLAEQFGFTSEYLTKIFKKYNHETPLKYITKLRIDAAKQILVNEPSLEIKKIGEYVGYPDAFYFSRVFKSSTGEYPSEYRAKILACPSDNILQGN